MALAGDQCWTDLEGGFGILTSALSHRCKDRVIMFIHQVGTLGNSEASPGPQLME